MLTFAFIGAGISEYTGNKAGGKSGFTNITTFFRKINSEEQTSRGGKATEDLVLTKKVSKL